MWTPSSTTGWTTPATRPSSRCPAKSSRRRSGCSRCRRSTGAGWQNFKRNRRGYWSFWIFLVLFGLSLVRRMSSPTTGRSSSPTRARSCSRCCVDYPESKFGGFLATTDYRDPFVQDEINANGWMVWPPIRYSYRTVNNEIADAGAGAAVVDDDAGASAARAYPQGVDDPNCTIGNWNWLGTDDQAPRRGGAAHLRLPHLGRVRADAGDHLVVHRGDAPARCRAISAAGSTSASSASSRSGRRSRRSICCSSSPR